MQADHLTPLDSIPVSMDPIVQAGKGTVHPITGHKDPEGE